MRVAYVCADPGVPVLGSKGCSVHVQEMVSALRRRGLDVEVFAARIGQGQMRTDLNGMKIHHVPIDEDKRNGAERENACLRANRDFQSCLHQAGPFDLIYERYSLWSHAGMSYAQSHSLPGILEVNAPLIREQRKYRTLHRIGAARAVAQLAFDRAHSVIAVSREVAASIRQDFGLNGKVHAVANGVNVDRFAPRPAGGGNVDVVTIGFCGSLKPWHGLADLLTAFSRLHDSNRSTRLVIIGDGPEREGVGQQVQRLGIQEVVVMAGALPPQQVPEALHAIDIATAPYRDSDFYFSPLKVFEYMAAGLAIVASDVGQIRRILRHRSNGLLFSPGDPDHLKSALGELCKNRDLRLRLGGNARREAVKKHSWDRVAGRVLATIPTSAGAIQ